MWTECLCCLCVCLPARDYHTFGVEVNTTAVRFYVDNTTSFVRELTPFCPANPDFAWGTTAYAPFAPLYGIINTAVVPNTNLTWWKTNNATLLVDWVRWYAWEPAAEKCESE